MISIFNGRSRSLGGAKIEVYVQVSVEMRQYLHLLKGASLAVFMAISLHADEQGFAFPSVPLLCRETGYNRDTVFKALAHLRELEIDGHRMLCSAQREGEKGKFASNGYLIFPSADEAAQYDAGKAARDENHVGVSRSKAKNASSGNGETPHTGFSDAVDPHRTFSDAAASDAAASDAVQPNAVFSDAKNSQAKVKPAVSKTIYKENHHQPEPEQVAPASAPASQPDMNGDEISIEIDEEAEKLSALVAALVKEGVWQDEASRLVRIKRGAVERELAWWPKRDKSGMKDPGAILRKHIMSDTCQPPAEASQGAGTPAPAKQPKITRATPEFLAAHADHYRHVDKIYGQPASAPPAKPGTRKPAPTKVPAPLVAAWEAALETLSHDTSINKPAYETHIRFGSRPIMLSGNTLVIEADTEFTRDWLERKRANVEGGSSLAGAIADAIAVALGLPAGSLKTQVQLNPNAAQEKEKI